MTVPLQRLEPQMWIFQSSLVEEAIFNIDQSIVFNSFIFFRLFKKSSHIPVSRSYAFFLEAYFLFSLKGTFIC